MVLNNITLSVLPQIVLSYSKQTDRLSNITDSIGGCCTLRILSEQSCLMTATPLYGKPQRGLLY